MKDRQKIILLSILAGITTWLIDALIDSFIFSKGSFWAMIFMVDSHELLMRWIFLIVIIFIGVLSAGFVSRNNKLGHGRIAAEKALHESEDRLRSVMESIADSIYLVDAEYRYLFMNRKHQELLGLIAKDYIGRSYKDFHSPEETNEFVESVNKVFKVGNTIRNEHFSRRDKRYLLRTFSPVKDADARIVAVTVVSKDVNDLKQLEEKLRNLSLTDDLTGLYNRRGFFTMVEPLLKLAKRHKKSAFLLYADLDDLKEINDVLGHHEGDQAIVDTANIFKTAFRETDIVARIGGDEFVVIPIAGEKKDADIVTLRLKENIRKHNEKKDRVYKLSISVGMSSYIPGDSSSIDDLLKLAEKMMYEEKILKQKTG